MQWDQEQLKAKLAELELEHRDLDDVINNLTRLSDFDQIKVSRLKKRKLALKDQITSLRGRLIPDIIA
ncbi:MAG: YdcH family protein [Rhodospirillaceae bacterium]